MTYCPEPAIEPPSDVCPECREYVCACCPECELADCACLDCATCKGSGGGADYALRCHACRGTGLAADALHGERWMPLYGDWP